MRAALLAPILPRVMKEGESKKAALILLGHYSIYQGPDYFNQIEVSSVYLFNIIFLSQLFQTTRLCNLQLKSVQVDDGCEESYQGDERGDAGDRKLPGLLLERTQQERQLVRRSLQSPSSVR